MMDFGLNDGFETIPCIAETESVSTPDGTVYACGGNSS